MNKKIVVLSVVAVFALVGVSLTSAIGFSLSGSDEDKVSPLYKVRTNRAINTKEEKGVDALEASYVGERIFILSMPLFKDDNSVRDQLSQKWNTAIGPGCYIKRFTESVWPCWTGFVTNCN